jgi:cell division protein FtsQ
LRLQSSSFFVVRQVRVLGASSVDPRAVAGLSGVQGKRLYEIDASAVSSTLERLALIQSAGVRRVWPNTVEIRVQERQPWGTWQIGGVNYLVDARGVVLDIVPTPWNATVYELDAAPGLAPGDRVDSDAVGMARILLDQLPHTILQQVARLEYSPDAGLEILTDQGVRVRMGDSQGLEFKLAVWQALNAKVGAGHIHLLDLRSPEHPFYR